MAKGANDLILRDRMQFDAGAGGSTGTLYGRFDLSDYVNTLSRKGLAIKEINLMLRDSGAGNTGNFLPSLGTITNATATNVQTASWKVFATTRAYEDAATVGIASPDVLHIETWNAYLGPQPPGAPAATSSYMYADHSTFPVRDLHPDGYAVVTDLLIGVATDSWARVVDKTIEIDVMIIAEPITITQARLTEMLVQGQDQ